MNDDEPIDLAPLDPARDGPGWERRINDVVAAAQQHRRPTVLRAVARRSGVIALALAAAAAAAVWLGRRPPATTAAPRRDPIDTWTRWAYGEPIDPLSLVDDEGAPR